MKTKPDTAQPSLPPAGVLARALRWYLASLLITAVILFVPAGSLSYWNAWLYLASLFIPMFVALVYMLVKDPELLTRRLQMKEKQEEQKTYYRLSLVFFIAAFSMPGIDYRFGWSHVPLWLVFSSLAVMVTGYAMFLLVIRANRYASRIIEIQEDQVLVDTGPYSVIRHPLYCAALLIYIPSPLVLGSYYALLIMILLPFLIAYRIKNEEAVLADGLRGYREYMEKVRYRLIPHIW